MPRKKELWEHIEFESERGSYNQITTKAKIVFNAIDTRDINMKLTAHEEEARNRDIKRLLSLRIMQLVKETASPKNDEILCVLHEYLLLLAEVEMQSGKNYSVRPDKQMDKVRKLIEEI